VADPSTKALQRDIAVVSRGAQIEAEILRAETKQLRQYVLSLSQARGAVATAFVVSAMLGAVAALRSYRSGRNRRS